MSLSIDDALRDGFSRTTARTGLVLIAVFLVFGFLNTVVGQSLSQAMFERLSTTVGSDIARETGRQNPFTGMGGENPLAVPLGPGVAAVLALVFGILAETLRIVSVRVFASDATASFPTSLATRRLVAATANGIVAGILVSIATFVGILLFVVPGLFVALSFFFVRQEIAVEDKNFVDAMSDSWTLTKGNRWELLGLGIILAVISFLVGSPGTVLAFLSPTVGTVVSTVLGAVTTVFSVAVVTRAYEQLRRERAARMDPDAGPVGDDPGGFGETGRGTDDSDDRFDDPYEDDFDGGRNDY